MMTSDGRVLTEAENAAHDGLVMRLSWASLHWGKLQDEALPHLAIAAVGAATRQIRADVEARVRVTIVAEIEAAMVVEGNREATDSSTGIWDGLARARAIAAGSGS